MAYHAHAFIDGGYLREVARRAGRKLPNPRMLALQVVNHGDVQDWANPPTEYRGTALTRVIYYDARPDDDGEIPEDRRSYWEAVQVLKDTHLGFGMLRGRVDRRAPRQKGVDTLIAVDMLVGAFTGIYTVAILFAGDADFVPVVNEVQRRGAMVVVVADPANLSEDLRRAADRVVLLDVVKNRAKEWFPPLERDGKTWDP